MNLRKNRDHSDHCIVNIGKNVEKNPRNLKRLAVTHEKPQAKAGVKNSQEVK